MKSLKIAICDDDRIQASIIEKLIEKIAVTKFINVDISVFFDGMTLKDYYRCHNSFDIVYLDIEMTRMDGIKTAQHIRAINSDVIIIFISGYENYFLQLFEVEPFRFIKKPIDPPKFEEVFCKAYERIMQQPIYFTYKYKKMIHKILLRDILFFESKGRIVNIILNTGDKKEFYGKLDNIEKNLCNTRIPFLRIHQSYYVNFIYIKDMSFSKIVLNNGMILSISEERQKFVRETFLGILGAEYNG